MNSGRCSIEFIHKPSQLQRKVNKMLINLQYAHGRRKQDTIIKTPTIPGRADIRDQCQQKHTICPPTELSQHRETFRSKSSRIMKDLAGIASPKRNAKSLPELAFHHWQRSSRTSCGTLGEVDDNGFSFLKPSTEAANSSGNELDSLRFALLLILGVLRHNFCHRGADRR